MTSDRILIERIREGEQQAFAQIIERYKNRIFHTCLRMLKNRQDAEEAAQDTFVRAYRGLEKFRGDSTFSTWIFRICMNTCLNYLDRKKPLATKSIDDEPTRLPKVESAEKFLESREMEGLIQKITAELPANYHSVIVLYHIQHFSYQEIAEVLNLPINTVKTHLSRARSMIRKRILQLMPKEELLASIY